MYKILICIRQIHNLSYQALIFNINIIIICSFIRTGQCTVHSRHGYCIEQRCPHVEMSACICIFKYFSAVIEYGQITFCCDSFDNMQLNPYVLWTVYLVANPLLRVHCAENVNNIQHVTLFHVDDQHDLAIICKFNNNTCC